jgi:NAD(P)H-hydrate epimerase
MKIVTAKQMRALDQKAVSRCGIPSLLLMESAAFGIVERLFGFYPSVSSVSIFCGKGNNGGDGLAAARHLLRRGVSVRAALLAGPEGLRGDAKKNFEILSKLGGEIHFAPTSSELSKLPRSLFEADLLLDAIFGTGLSQAVSGHLAEAIEKINGSKRRIVAVDLPSGISSDTGRVLGSAIRAERTFALALPKRGHFLSPGLDHRGKLSVIDIGIPPFLIEQAGIEAELLTPDLLKPLLPLRPRAAHKGILGHLLILAGCRGKGGAATMAARGALRSGVGLLTLAHPQGTRPPEMPMEGMTLPLPETAEGTLSLAGRKALQEALEGKDAVALGPGLSRNPETLELVRELIFGIPLPMAIDADGIDAVAGNLGALRSAPAPRVLTPHPGEMARLIGARTGEVVADRMEIARKFATEHGVVLVLKGSHTVVAKPDGTFWVNPTGNPGMATGGSGDVLTGMIGGYLARGIPAAEAAALGVYLHGLAGDLAASDLGESGMTPSDLIERIPKAARLLQKSGVHPPLSGRGIDGEFE